MEWVQPTVTILTTAVVTFLACFGAGWALLDLRLAKFQGELMDKLNGTYVRAGEYDLTEAADKKILRGLESDMRIILNLKRDELILERQRERRRTNP